MSVKTTTAETAKTNAVKANNKAESTSKVAKYSAKLPEVNEFLKAGVQFGHESRKWDPKMQKFIFGKRNNIHIIDISKTLPLLEEALQFVYQKATEGNVLFVGTKRQASEIVKEKAVKSGSFFVVNRWPGGLLTNFDLVKKSLATLNKLESELRTGVEGRTKFEVSNMKKQWAKMNRVYEGIKMMQEFPKVLFIVDIKFERNALKEAKKLGIPVVAIVDTNSDPTVVDYPIPANDDALGSIQLILELFAEAVKAGNKGRGIKHEFIDYTKHEVKLIKGQEQQSETVEVETGDDKPADSSVMKVTRDTDGKPAKGILETIQESKEKSK